MKSIQHNGQISSITAKVDRSLGYRVNTGELSSEEKAAFFELQNMNCLFIIRPLDVTTAGLVEVKSEVDTKTPSQRLRAVMFLLWRQNHEGHEQFDTFYKSKMDAFIEHLKEKIEE
jgi:hypothetical protein